MPAPAIATRPLRIYVMEPQPLLGKALCRILSDDMDIEIVGESRFFDQAALVQGRPEIVIADWDEEIENVAQLVARTRSALPNVRICMLSGHMSAGVMMRAISSGVDGYIAKDIRPAELTACLKQVATDGFYADARLTKILLRERSRGEAVQLSRRELDVVRLVAEGLSNKEIASRLMLSDKTVKNHIANIFSKLNLSARTQIAVYALRNGIL